MTEQPLIEMSNDEFYDAVVRSMQGWIPLRTYLRLFPEESKTAIETRIQRKHWVRGVHFNTPEGGKLWVNVIAIGQWAAGSEGESGS